MEKQDVCCVASDHVGCGDRSCTDRSRAELRPDTAREIGDKHGDEQGEQEQNGKAWGVCQGLQPTTVRRLNACQSTAGDTAESHGGCSKQHGRSRLELAWADEDEAERDAGQQGEDIA